MKMRRQKWEEEGFTCSLLCLSCCRSLKCLPFLPSGRTAEFYETPQLFLFFFFFDCASETQAMSICFANCIFHPCDSLLIPNQNQGNNRKKKKTSIDLFALTSPCASWDVLIQHFWASGPKYHCVHVPYQLTLRRLKYSEISKMPLNSSIYLNCNQNLRL